MKWFISEFNNRAWRLIKEYQLENAPGVTLIYGPRGLGKSALLRYLYQQTELKYGSQMTDALSFARQYAYAAHENKINLFRQRYRTTQLLLIDDLQCIAGKIKTIEELHYTYESVISHGGKMVITVEAGFPNLDFLGEKLASRFLSGIVIPIDRPQKHEIEHFLSDYIHTKRLYLNPNVVGVIAERTNNLAETISTITQFVQFAESRQDELSLSCFNAYWEKEINNLNSVAEPKNIIRLVSQTMGVSIEELLSPDRKQRVNEARQMAIYVIRTLCRLSYPAIGSYFNRNHNTMITSYNKMQEKLAKDQELIKLYKRIINAFKA
ncbi:Chromosomal replication initiator protein DnaA [Desulfosporosinus sp. I2]|uniref:DnaA/Hda family protein n=1 Tax=Desulfosporosinus sp. I2 TaxID=1617025 RepID=UPI0005EDC6D6|nr:DnaA/Hda family protein [Desulfosporosinus sp. I2]KJR44608.1 Chromosomal replication initiator protein DnaA [Desulfosporosinus sp. I2]